MPTAQTGRKKGEKMVYSPLEAELRNLRKGRGLTLVRLRNSPVLLAALDSASVHDAFDKFVATLMRLDDGIRSRAIRNAYGIGVSGDLLTQRREDFALAEQRHGDTIEKYENEMIAELVKLLGPRQPDNEPTPVSVRIQLTVDNGLLSRCERSDQQGDAIVVHSGERGLGRDHAIFVVGTRNERATINAYYSVIATGISIKALFIKCFDNYIKYNMNDWNHMREETYSSNQLDGVLAGLEPDTLIEFRWTLEQQPVPLKPT